jgi:hypothetical protein
MAIRFCFSLFQKGDAPGNALLSSGCTRLCAIVGGCRQYGQHWLHGVAQYGRQVP